MSQTGSVCAVVLAAGDGTRMKSGHPKAMCEVLFRPMILWVADNCASAGIESFCAVLGSGADEITAILPKDFNTVLQPQRRGTGHAASMARDYLREGGFSYAAVLNGDAPLLSAEHIAAALQRHKDEGNAVTVITAELPDPAGYGRVLRGKDGGVTAIAEDSDANAEQRAVREINSGAYWFNASFLLDFFDNMGCDNAQGEYYLPDCVAYAVGAGLRAGAHRVPARAALGANNRAELAALNGAAREAVLAAHMENGVNIPFADGVVIGPEAEIGSDTTILPGTIIRGRSRIGSDCEIGPNSYIISSDVGDGCKIVSSQLESAKLKNGVRIGPMSNLRPNSHIGANAKIGDFVEVKNSVIGERTSLAHLTYIGDSDVGSGCNFGCGVVTVNYDGKGKYRTVVGNDSFIGCNVNLVAPVKVGDKVYAAAGTTITEEVPDEALVIGRARQVVKENWVKDRGRYKK